MRRGAHHSPWRPRSTPHTPCASRVGGASAVSPAAMAPAPTLGKTMRNSMRQAARVRVMRARRARVCWTRHAGQAAVQGCTDRCRPWVGVHANARQKQGPAAHTPLNDGAVLTRPAPQAGRWHASGGTSHGACQEKVTGGRHAATAGYVQRNAAAAQLQAGQHNQALSRTAPTRHARTLEDTRKQ